MIGLVLRGPCLWSLGRMAKFEIWKVWNILLVKYLRVGFLCLTEALRSAGKCSTRIFLNSIQATVSFLSMSDLSMGL